MNEELLYELSPDELEEVFEETIASIEDAFEAGELTEDEALGLIDDAEEDLITVAEDNGYLNTDDYADDYDEDDGYEDDYDDEDYAGGLDLATFRSGTDFGDVIVALGNEVGYETIDDLVLDLADELGLNELDVAQLISGEIAPSNDTVLAIADAFGVADEDEETVATLLETGAYARGEDPEDMYEDLADAVDEMEEAGYEDPEEVADDVDEALQYSRDLADKEERLQDLEAEFTESQIISATQEDLFDLEQRVVSGVNQGWLPPFLANQMVGNFSDDGDRIAAFSTLCDAEDQDPGSMLYAIHYALDAFERCGGMINFNSMAYEEPLDPEEEAAFNQLETEARRTVRQRRQTFVSGNVHEPVVPVG